MIFVEPRRVGAGRDWGTPQMDYNHTFEDEDHPEIGSPTARGPNRMDGSDEELEAEVNRGLERILQAAAAGDPTDLDEPLQEQAQYDSAAGRYMYESEEDLEPEGQQYDDHTHSPHSANDRQEFAQLAAQRRQASQFFRKKKMGQMRRKMEQLQNQNTRLRERATSVDRGESPPPKPKPGHPPMLRLEQPPSTDWRRQAAKADRAKQSGLPIAYPGGKKKAKKKAGGGSEAAAAVRLQASMRGWAERNRQIKDLEGSLMRVEMAATFIQSRWRGVMAMRRVTGLAERNAAQLAAKLQQLQRHQKLGRQMRRAQAGVRMGGRGRPMQSGGRQQSGGPGPNNVELRVRI